MLSTRRCGAAWLSLSLAVFACGSEDNGANRSPIVPGPGGAGGAGGAAGGMMIGTAGSSGAGAGAGAAGAAGMAAGAGAAGAAGGSGASGMSGAAGMMTAGMGARGGMGGMAGMMMAGMGARGGMGGMGGMAGAGMGGMGGATMPAADMNALRQSCVDTINMYRATLGRPPLRRATPEQEACSDMGAKKDGDSGMAHGSAGDCMGLGAQNTCPGYPVRGMGVAGIETSLKGCLMQMWAEGMPPVPVADCIRDSRGCFQEYGHWINMQSTSSQVVSCGFYMMANGRYWMNQDFGR